MQRYLIIFFFNDTATTEIYTLSLHDALPIYARREVTAHAGPPPTRDRNAQDALALSRWRLYGAMEDGLRLHADDQRSEEHTSELQSRQYLVCRLLLEKKNMDN